MKHINVSLFVPHLGCPNACIFCNQKTISGKCGVLTREEILSAVNTAIKGNHDINNSEIAFFGGSFTAIEESLMINYLETVKPFIGTHFKGIRISTRPDCIDENKLALLKKYGVTSIELGAQSMCGDVLIKNERGHTPEDTEKAAELIKKAGFSLGLQMMTGLFSSDSEKDIYTAKKFVELKPDTVRIYPTAVLQGTALEKLYERGEYTPPTLSEAVELCSKLLRLFNENGIRVIRLGLHSGGNVEEGFVAGVYHPAFRELVEAEIYKDKIQEKLEGLPDGEYTLSVCSRDLSKAGGHKKSNILYFGEKGKTIRLVPDDNTAQYDVLII